MVKVCFFSLVSFALKCVRKVYCGDWFLEPLLCLEFISAVPILDFLRAAVTNRNPRPGEGEVLGSLLGRVVVTGNFTGDCAF